MYLLNLKGLSVYSRFSFSYPELSIGFNLTKTTNTMLEHQKPFLFFKPQVRLFATILGTFSSFKCYTGGSFLS